MFGGVNLKSYCSSKLWNFTLHTLDKSKVKHGKARQTEIKSRDSLFGTGIYDTRHVLSDRHALFIRDVRSLVNVIQNRNEEEFIDDDHSSIV